MIITKEMRGVDPSGKRIRTLDEIERGFGNWLISKAYLLSIIGHIVTDMRM